MYYHVRFKRWKEEHVFLANAEPYSDEHPYGLCHAPVDAERLYSVNAAKAIITAIAELTIPAKPYEFNLTTLFLIRLFGKEWDDQCEGMLVDMDDVIKAQIVNDKLEVVETIRLRCPVWSKHYA
jgi:hypothetical protein